MAIGAVHSQLTAVFVLL